MLFRRSIIATLLTMGLFSFLFRCSKRKATQQEAQPAALLAAKPAAQPVDPIFNEFTSVDSARLDKQRHVVAMAVKQRYGTLALTKTTTDLPVLQRLLDDKVFSKNQAYELQCLGVAFGDVLTSELPLRWMMVTDEYGTDPTLRFKDTMLQINALTMISKRIERDEAVNVVDLLRITGQQLEQFEKNQQK